MYCIYLLICFRACICATYIVGLDLFALNSQVFMRGSMNATGNLKMKNLYIKINIFPLAIYHNTLKIF